VNGVNNKVRKQPTNPSILMGMRVGKWGETYLCILAMFITILLPLFKPLDFREVFGRLDKLCF
jgi:hypothetical protein